MKELINRPEGSVKYLSQQIQDVKGRVKADIINEINKAPFYSIIMDTMQDVSKIDQLSQVYRYETFVKNDMDIATDIQINEVFWGFEATVGSSVSELENQFLGSIEKNGIDGATNMSGAYSGVQARITEGAPCPLRSLRCS